MVPPDRVEEVILGILILTLVIGALLSLIF